MKVELSIVVPAYNEEAAIGQNLKSLKKNFPKAEVILVDDGSTDATLAGASEVPGVKIIKNKTNLGKGQSVKKGVLKATGDYIIFCDADLPFKAEGIQKVLTELKKESAQVIIVEKIGYHKDLGYQLSKRLVRLLIKLIFGLNFRDTQAGLKGFKREAAQKIFKELRTAHFAFDVEALFLAKKHNFEVVSLPLKVEGSVKTTFNLGERIRFVWELFKIKRNLA